jgi:hypothetical protein
MPPTPPITAADPPSLPPSPSASAAARPRGRWKSEPKSLSKARHCLVPSFLLLLLLLLLLLSSAAAVVRGGGGMCSRPQTSDP